MKKVSKNLSNEKVEMMTADHVSSCNFVCV